MKLASTREESGDGKSKGGYIESTEWEATVTRLDGKRRQWKSGGGAKVKEEETESTTPGRNT